MAVGGSGAEGASRSECRGRESLVVQINTKQVRGHHNDRFPDMQSKRCRQEVDKAVPGKGRRTKADTGGRWGRAGRRWARWRG